MTIQVEATEIPEVKIISGPRFWDERGFFSETYKLSEFVEIGLPKFVQDNLSESSKGVIRGLHWQEEPYSQGKLVTCLSGSITDIAVDIRKSSPTFGKFVSIELNSLEPKSIWIPSGFAHGFQALEDRTRVFYKVTNYWNKSSERSLNFADPTLNIDWKIKDFSISEKDKLADNLSSI